MQNSPNTIHTIVREHYADRARQSDPCCGPGDSECGTSNVLYADQLLTGLPSDVADFSLGCGDPISLAALQPGETVLDLGSGGGLDCFLAARQVGETGRVIGVDMTPEMLERARAAAARLGAANVEFRQGYLEALPVEDASVDIVISNCVINLSPDKPGVFREIFRALKAGGRLAVSDIVTNGPLPASVQTSMEAWGACIAGALDVRDYTRGLAEAGFAEVRAQPRGEADKMLSALPIGVPFSAAVTARKPASPASPPDPSPDRQGMRSGEGRTSPPLPKHAVPLRETRERTGGDAGGETLECTAPGGVETRQGDIERLLSRVAEARSIADGYELRITGDAAETRALAETFIRAEASCCSFLRFDVADAPDGLIVRVTGSPSGIQFATRVVAHSGPDEREPA